MARLMMQGDLTCRCCGHALDDNRLIVVFRKASYPESADDFKIEALGEDFRLIGVLWSWVLGQQWYFSVSIVEIGYIEY
ncbi:hypothetical protein ACHAQH_005679 [Verticillium albo-atrum]